MTAVLISDLNRSPTERSATGTWLLTVVKCNHSALALAEVSSVIDVITINQGDLRLADGRRHPRCVCWSGWS